MYLPYIVQVSKSTQILKLNMTGNDGKMAFKVCVD